MMTLPFETNIDILNTEVMNEYGLGPNGGILTSLKSENFFIGTKAVLFHQVLIPQRVVDINVGPEW
jgi:hypothetical protein